MKRRSFLQTLGLGATFTSLSGCGSGVVTHAWKSQEFNTDLSITYHTPLSADQIQKLQQDLDNTVELASKRFSLERDLSTINQLNTHKTVEADPEFVSVIQRCIDYAKVTNGMFNVTVQPLWDWYTESSKKISLESVLEAVNYRHIQIDGSTVTLSHPQAKLTLNGMIQGYLTDQLYQVCKSHGITSAIINGGEYRAIGLDSNGSPWSIPVRSKNGAKLTVAILKDGEALAVSAGYGYQFKSAENTSHIFDPTNQTKTSTSSTSVVTASNAEIADVYATLLTLLPSSLHHQVTKKVIGFEVIEN